MLKIHHVLVIVAALAVSGCSTWSTAKVEPAPEAAGTTAKDSGTKAEAKAAPAEKTNPADILVTKDDIEDRPYRVLGDINVTVNKTTLFHPDPTPALVDEELREEAAELGADAVILVRYGTVGVGLASWGSLDGNGRAIAFEE
ncbi:hypothetical protein [Pelagibius sp. Alg239-R121]|uniref:hypothetical protein n=1 Tax=Pelagibius sp. Alg239-R121 TaxID=2993448 RepID=UPI0024A6E86D|nr:hypothetical protein [Pelagibius sp. Alg239-R121]